MILLVVSLVRHKTINSFVRIRCEFDGMAKVPLLILSGFATYSSFRRIEWKQLNLIGYLSVKFNIHIWSHMLMPMRDFSYRRIRFWTSFVNRVNEWNVMSIHWFDVNSQFAICLRSLYTHHNNNCTRIGPGVRWPKCRKNNYEFEAVHFYFNTLGFVHTYSWLEKKKQEKNV